MDWERIGRISGRFFLILIELVFKLCATVGAAIVLATPGGFSEKVGAGFGSLSTWLRKLTAAPAEIMEIGRTINDFTTHTTAEFSEAYGAGTIEILIYDLNTVVEYFQSVFRNLTQNPFSTFFGALVVFLAFYILARTLRFYRQKGQGSPLVRLERWLGEKAFDLDKAAKVEELLASKARQQQTSKSPNRRSASTPRSQSQASAYKSGRPGIGTGSSGPAAGTGRSTAAKPKAQSESGNESSSSTTTSTSASASTSTSKSPSPTSSSPSPSSSSSSSSSSSTPSPSSETSSGASGEDKDKEKEKVKDEDKEKEMEMENKDKQEHEEDKKKEEDSKKNESKPPKTPPKQDTGPQSLEHILKSARSSSGRGEH